jgi:hypothetical protein
MQIVSNWRHPNTKLAPQSAVDFAGSPFIGSPYSLMSKKVNHVHIDMPSILPCAILLISTQEIDANLAP